VQQIVQQRFLLVMQVLQNQCGGVAEWLNAAVLKTVRLERASGVRIPPPPPDAQYSCLEFFGPCLGNQYAMIRRVAPTLLRLPPVK
jgi:hypothetical protein